jgi:uncharacterized protein (TIGR00159 family)
MPELLDFFNRIVWASLRVADLVDVALIATALYGLIVWLRHRVSRTVGVGLVALVVAYALAQVLNLYLTTAAFRVGVTFLIFGFILVFQEDLRRALERLRTYQLWGNGLPEHDSWDPLEAIVGAVWQLADQSTGALIVVKGAELIDIHTQGGTPVGGTVTESLLTSLFQPETPSHDGAVIIEDDEIEAFGVHLPLSSDDDQHPDRGTRHSAAVGLAERADALVIVVSEETGRVSVARKGRLETIDQKADLEARLAAHFNLEGEADKPPRWKQILTSNPGAKLASVLLAGLLWVVMANNATSIQRTYTIPIEYQNLPDNLSIEQQYNRAEIEIDGPERAFRPLEPDNLSVSLDLSDETTGTRDFVLSREQIELPPELNLRDIRPSRVSATIYRMTSVTLPVAVRTEGELPGGLEVASLQPDPPVVDARVRKALENRITEIPTVPVNLSEIETSTTVETALVPLPHVQWDDEVGGRIEVTVRLRNGGPPPESKPPPDQPGG